MQKNPRPKRGVSTIVRQIIKLDEENQFLNMAELERNEQKDFSGDKTARGKEHIYLYLYQQKMTQHETQLFFANSAVIHGARRI